MTHAQLPVQRIVSGGQTGVDRAALDVARERGISHGGWCPRGRLAEDGPIDARYHLRETDSPEYGVRTEQNVIDSDATLILYRGDLGGGTLLTRHMAEKHRRPHHEIDLAGDCSPREAAAEARVWLAEQNVQVLNIAGPRESTAPGIGEEAKQLLREIFA